MRVYRILVHRIRSLSRRARAEADLQREMELHIVELTKEFVAAGVSESEARLLARREFGSVEVTKEKCRDARRVNLLEDAGKDLVYACRPVPPESRNGAGVLDTTVRTFPDDARREPNPHRLLRPSRQLQPPDAENRSSGGVRRRRGAIPCRRPILSA